MKKKRGRPSSKEKEEKSEFRQDLEEERAQFKAFLRQTLIEKALLSNEKAGELAEKYISLGDFAKAVRAGEDMGVEDPAKLERIRLIGLSR